MKDSDPILTYPDIVQGSVQGFSEQESSILETINQKIAAEETLDDIMNYLFESTRSIFPCDRIGLAFIEEENNRIISHWAKADYSPVLLNKGYSEDLQSSSLLTVIKTGKPRIINDLALYLTHKPESRSTAILVKEGVRSSMTCPLVVEKRIVGLLWRSSRRPHSYNEKQAGLHLAIAERLSQAVEKAYRIEQLSASNKAYFEMLGFVSHELKSPVSSMVTSAQLLHQGYFGEVPDEQKKQLEKLIRKGEYLLGLVRDYLDLSRLEGGQLKLEIQKNLDLLVEIIQPSIDLVQPQLIEKQMTLTSNIQQGTIHVDLDPDLFKIIMVNLLGNAVKYGKPEGNIRITCELISEKLRISVYNEGPGFPESEKPRLFRKFSRLNTPELRKVKGTGVGLYTVWRIIRAHNGKIDASSQHGHWAEFIVEIPQPFHAGRQ